MFTCWWKMDWIGHNQKDKINIYFLNISFFLCAKLPESNYRISFISAFALNCECFNNYFHFSHQETCSTRNHEKTSALHLSPSSRSNNLFICKLLGGVWGKWNLGFLIFVLGLFCFVFVCFLFNDFKVCAELHDCLRDRIAQPLELK